MFKLKVLINKQRIFGSYINKKAIYNSTYIIFWYLSKIISGGANLNNNVLTEIKLNKKSEKHVI